VRRIRHFRFRCCLTARNRKWKTGGRQVNMGRNPLMSLLTILYRHRGKASFLMQRIKQESSLMGGGSLACLLHNLSPVFSVTLVSRQLISGTSQRERSRDSGRRTGNGNCRRLPVSLSFAKNKGGTENGPRGLLEVATRLKARRWCYVHTNSASGDGSTKRLERGASPTSSSTPKEGGGTGSCSFPRSLSNSGSERPLNTSRFLSTEVAESGMIKGG
jgi:hypothetical protein